MRTRPGPPIPTADEARALLADQLARPVEFVTMIEAMYRSGVRTFVEVGPDRKLTGLVGAILGNRHARGHRHRRLARGQRSNLVDLARALAEIAALGHPVHLTLWDDGDDLLARAGKTLTRKPGLTVKVCGRRTRSPKVETARRTRGRQPAQPTTTSSTSSNPNLDASSTMTPTPSARFSTPHAPSANGNGTGMATDHPGPGRNGTKPEPNVAPPRPSTVGPAYPLRLNGRRSRPSARAIRP